MKRIFTLAFAALLLAGSVMAQDNSKKENKKDKAGKEWKAGDKKGKHGKHKGAFAKELNLTDAQKEQIKAINQEYKGKEKASREERKAKFESVLTAEQKAKLEQMKQQRKAEGKERGEKRFESMKKDLNLSDVQGQQIKTLNEDFRNKAKAIKDNTSLTQEQKKEQLKALHEQRQAQMKSILTAEQQQKIEAKKKEFKNKKNKKATTK
jgi:Spy/CpxP family protein refolding chaperone